MLSPETPALRKFLAPEFIFGVGARSLAGQYAKNFGARKVLVVSDPGVMAAGWTQNVIQSLEQTGLPYSIFSKVSPNPRQEEVMAGAAFFKTEECNVIVAVGGGSVIDSAKGIGIVHSTHKALLQMEGVDKVDAPMPPLICIPTTGGTSADLSQFAIFTNLQKRVKFAIISKAVVPDVSLIDPETLITMDADLTAWTGIDALVHAIEAYVSNAHSSVTDMHALEAIRLIAGNLLPSMHDLGNLTYRTKVMQGSLLAGLAFSNASLGAVHAMAHSLGGRLDLPHGECNAMLLTSVMDFNFKEAGARYDTIGTALGLDLRGMSSVQRKVAILNEVTRIRDATHLGARLAQKGVHRDDVKELAANSLEDPCIVTNPRRPNQRDIEVIFEEAL